MNKKNPICESLINQLKEMTSEWETVYTLPSSDSNFTTGTVYQRFNMWYLSLVRMGRKLELPFWATFNQVSKAGGRIKSGAKGTQITLQPMVFTIKDKEGNPVLDEDGNEKKGITYKHCIVFNADDIEGIDFSKYEVRHNIIEKADYEMIEELAEKRGIKVVSKDNTKAYYNVFSKEVNIPNKKYLKNICGTLLHELIHASAPAMGRKNENYAWEELVAELGAMIACQKLNLGFQFQQNNLAYVKTWWDRLDKNPNQIFSAYAEAQKAVDWLLKD